MKQKYFNFSLFWDFFKQTKLTGIILAVVLCIITAVPTFAQYISMGRGNSPAQISQIAPVLYFAIYFIPIVFTASIFKFLNKRRDSDFFHSLPPTRLCMFFSGCLASLLWSLITIVAMIFIGYISLLICGLSCPISYIGYLIAYNAVVALIITGCASIALSATGTLIPGLCLTLIIMFLPRLILTIINIMVREQSIIASALNDGLFFNQDYNFVTAPLFSALASGYSNAVSLPAFAGGYIYTGVLGLIYIFLGALTFRARKSESAEQSAPNRVLQHIYRLLITLPTLLAASVLIITTSSQDSLIIILIVLSIIIYFVYEAITTKSFKNMLKAAPLFLADIAICGIVCLTSSLMAQNVLNNPPQENEVSHIEINVSNESGFYNTPTYTQALQQTVKYKDKETISLACEQLNKTARTAASIKNNPAIDNYISGRSITFVLNSGTKVTRIVDFDSSEALFENLLWNEPAYVENLLKLPEENQITHLSSIWPMNINDDQAKSLWNSFKEEYYTLPDSTKAQIQEGYQKNSTPFSLNVMGNLGLTLWGNWYSITPLTPKTFELAAQYTNQAQTREAFKSALQSAKENSNYPNKYESYIEIGFYNVSGLDSFSEELALMLQDRYNMVVNSGDKEWEPVLELLSGSPLEQAKPEQPILTLTITTYEQDEEQGYYTRSKNDYLIASIDQAALETLLEILFPEETVNPA